MVKSAALVTVPMGEWRRLKKRAKKRGPRPQHVAHVLPRALLDSITRGDVPEGLAICGATVKAEPHDETTPVCRACFLKQLVTDDGKTDAAAADAQRRANTSATQSRANGLREGEANGRAAAMREIREAAERRAAAIAATPS